jgi:hypothetical protein
LQRAWPAQERPASPLLGILAGVLLLAMLGVRLTVPVTHRDGPVTPTAALAHVPRFMRDTPVLNGYGFGGYLIWNGIKPFIDSRADLYGDIFLQNYATIISPDKDALAASLAFHHVRWTPRRGAGGEAVDDTPGWRRFYTDKLAAARPRLASERPRERSDQRKAMDDDLDNAYGCANRFWPRTITPCARPVSISSAAMACGSTRSGKAMTRRCRGAAIRSPARHGDPDQPVPLAGV